MSTSRFRAGADSSPTDDDAQIIGSALEELEKRLGYPPRPEDFVQEARNPTSPLHPYLEHDDAMAGRLYRAEQVKRYMR